MTLFCYSTFSVRRLSRSLHVTPNLLTTTKSSFENATCLRNKLLYRSRKRGILETDLLLSTFANHQLPHMNLAQLKEYESLLDELDWDIYYWLVGKKETPLDIQSLSIWNLLKMHTRNEEKSALRMPAL